MTIDCGCPRIRALTLACALAVLTSSCSAQEAPEEEVAEQGAAPAIQVPEAVGPEYTDAVEILDILRGVGLHDPEYEDQCDDEMTINMSGYGTASCIVEDSELAVGANTNLIQVVVYADEEHAGEYLASADIPTWHGNGYFVTAPNDDLLTRAEEAILAQ